MLCDDLLEDRELRLCYDNLDLMFIKIRMAQKFVLSKEFTIAADGIVDNYTELEKIVPYCRIPFPKVWIEWVHDDRPHWDPNGPYGSRPVDPTRHQHPPHRCGFFLEQQDGRASRWKAHLFWSMKDKPNNGSQFNGSLGALILDVEEMLEDKDTMLEKSLNARVPAEFGQGLLQNLYQTNRSVFHRLLEYSVEDWGGELRFMTAVLGLMNTKNVVHVMPVDNEKYNAKRIRHNKRPLFSHKVLKVRPEIWVRNASQPIAHQHKDLRMHFVQGHFKHRKTGLFYWSHHVRGNIKHGAVLKDYEVKT